MFLLIGAVDAILHSIALMTVLDLIKISIKKNVSFSLSSGHSVKGFSIEPGMELDSWLTMETKCNWCNC